MATIIAILTSEFFWGVIVGTILAALGSYLTVRLQERSQRIARAELVRTFSIDTVRNLLQIMRDLQDLRGRTNSIQHDFLMLLDIEMNVFGRNREHIIYLTPQTREQLRRFVNAVSIKRAEIGNFLTEFYKQMALADQLTASGQGPQAQRVIAATTANQLARANTAADQLFQLVHEGEQVLRLLGST
jgi:hypothetical protein